MMTTSRSMNSTTTFLRYYALMFILTCHHHHCHRCNSGSGGGTIVVSALMIPTGSSGCSSRGRGAASLVQRKTSALPRNFRLLSPPTTTTTTGVVQPSSSSSSFSVIQQQRSSSSRETRTSLVMSPSSSDSSSVPLQPSDTNNSTTIQSIRRLLEWILSGKDIHTRRPEWTLPWMPTWLVTLRPMTQVIIGFFLYVFHLGILTQNSIPFPFQLIPNEKGHFQCIGLDSVAGLGTLAIYQYLRKQFEAKVTASSSTETMTTIAPTTTSGISSSEAGGQHPTDTEQRRPILPKLLSTPHVKDMPWKNVYESKYSRITGFLAFCALFQGYFWTGRLSLWWEDLLYTMANYYPMTIAMHRSLSVLLGHLSWVVMGFGILRLIPRPQPFRKKWYTSYFSNTSNKNDNINDTGNSVSKNDAQWLWWTIGGYFVSSLFFNIADFVNQAVLPVSILEQASNSVVSQLIQPEYNDIVASLAGYIAPCLSAPWWEEVLYRGFLLPALILQNIPYKWSVLLSGLIFSIHHLSPTGAIPLCVLGWTWNILYTKSGNLQTTILVHAMWNSRVFLGSWLGL